MFFYQGMWLHSLYQPFAWSLVLLFDSKMSYLFLPYNLFWLLWLIVLMTGASWCVHDICYNFVDVAWCQFESMIYTHTRCNTWGAWWYLMKVRGEHNISHWQSPPPTHKEYSMGGWVSSDWHCMSCSQRTQCVAVAASEFGNYEYGMPVDGVLWLTLHELQPQILAYNNQQSVDCGCWAYKCPVNNQQSTRRTKFLIKRRGLVWKSPFRGLFPPPSSYYVAASP